MAEAHEVTAGCMAIFEAQIRAQINSQSSRVSLKEGPNWAAHTQTRKKDNREPPEASGMDRGGDAGPVSGSWEPGKAVRLLGRKDRSSLLLGPRVGPEEPCCDPVVPSAPLPLCSTCVCDLEKLILQITTGTQISML